jgi:hypothetical protein
MQNIKLVKLDKSKLLNTWYFFNTTTLILKKKSIKHQSQY